MAEGANYDDLIHHRSEAQITRERQEAMILEDIEKLNGVHAGMGQIHLEAIHREMDGKYQCCIEHWGHSMYGYNVHTGFIYSIMDVDNLLDNLSLMKAKLQGFFQGWNGVGRYTTSLGNKNGAPDVNVTVNNSITVTITFEQVRSQIEEMTSLTDEQTQEALEKVSEIETVVKGDDNKKSKWEKIKPILVWLADKSFDVAMAMLPLLMQVKG